MIKRLILTALFLSLGLSQALSNELSNPEFTSTTASAELATDPGFDTGTGWSTQAPWSISGSTATHNGTAAGNLSTNDEPVPAYQSCMVTVEILEYNQSSNCEVRDTFFPSKQAINEFPSTDILYDCNTGSSPTDFALRAKGTDLTTIVLGGISLKTLTLDNWTEVGTRTATEHTCYDPNQGLVKFDSGGTVFSIKQALANEDYNMMLNVDTLTSGTVVVSDGGANSYEITSAGMSGFPLTIATGELYISTKGGAAASFIIDSVSAVVKSGDLSDINGLLLHVY